MPTVSYTVINGMIVHENRAGVQHDYLSDSLGSTYALVDDTGTMTDTFAYWPYGEARTSTGATGTPFTFCGTLGYHSDLESGMSYVRARYLKSALASWLTVDPLWPGEPSYTYAKLRAHADSDPTGTCTPPNNLACYEQCNHGTYTCYEFKATLWLGAPVLVDKVICTCWPMVDALKNFARRLTNQGEKLVRKEEEFLRAQRQSFCSDFASFMCKAETNILDYGNCWKDVYNSCMENT